MADLTDEAAVSGARLAELIRLYTPHPEIVQNGHLWACLRELQARRAADRRLAYWWRQAAEVFGAGAAKQARAGGAARFTATVAAHFGRLALGQREEG